MIAGHVESLIDIMHGLIAVMEEESERIALCGPSAAAGELSSSKTRLAGRMEEQVARLVRMRADWGDVLDEELRARLSDVYADLYAASVVNSEVLEFQIDPSTEMPDAIAHRAGRIAGPIS